MSSHTSPIKELSYAQILERFRREKTKINEELNEKTDEMRKLMDKVQTSEVRRQTVFKCPYTIGQNYKLDALHAQVKRLQLVIDKIANKLKECNESVTRYEKLVESSSGSSTLGSTGTDV